MHLALGGAVVGVLSIVCPEVCGNGASVVSGLLHGHYVWNVLVVILILKILATAATFGSGAVGGVFTPTLFIGACLGSLVAWVIQALWPGQAVFATGFTLVGMGAFLAATTHAPLMAILILFELTLDYQMVPPLMLACVVAHFVSRSFERESIYADSLKQKGVEDFQQQLTTMRVSQIMRKDSVTVSEAARFAEIAERFIANQFSYLYVVGGGNIFKGVISLHDIKAYLNDQNLASLVIAGDIMRPDFPTITPDAFMTDALNRFSQHDGERLPVIGRAGELLGSLSKSDVMLALSEAVTEEGREL